jgi:hypothetical protein
MRSIEQKFDILLSNEDLLTVAMSLTEGNLTVTWSTRSGEPLELLSSETVNRVLEEIKQTGVPDEACANCGHLHSKHYHIPYLGRRHANKCHARVWRRGREKECGCMYHRPRRQEAA